MPEFGGLRHTQKNSVNRAWKSASFRGFANDMQTPEFSASLKELIRLFRQKRTVILCAEALPWRCHRSLMTDALLAHGFKAFHLMNPKKAVPRKLIPWARVKGNPLTYPG